VVPVAGTAAVEAVAVVPVAGTAAVEAVAVVPVAGTAAVEAVAVVPVAGCQPSFSLLKIFRCVGRKNQSRRTLRLRTYAENKQC